MQRFGCGLCYAYCFRFTKRIVEEYSKIIVRFSQHNLRFLTHPSSNMDKTSIESHLSNVCSFLNQCHPECCIPRRENFWRYVVACAWRRMRYTQKHGGLSM